VKKYHIAFDMDDTLCALVGPSIEVAKRILGKQLFRPRYGQYVGWFPGQLNDAERAELLSHVYTPEFYLGLPSNFHPARNTTIKRISQCATEHYASIRVITARGKVLVENADKIDIHVHEHSVKKPTFCSGPTVMVDDAVHVADDFAVDEDHKVIMIDQTWNEGYPRRQSVLRTSPHNLCNALISSAA
jgi:hypothetical protein